LQPFFQWRNGLDHFLHRHLCSAVRRQAQKDKRRWAKQTSVAGIDVSDASLPDLNPEFLERLRPLLTRRENDYVAWLKQAVAEVAPPCPFSKARARQLRRSIRAKARKLRRADEMKDG
jgi:hypothetical protein